MPTDQDVHDFAPLIAAVIVVCAFGLVVWVVF